MTAATNVPLTIAPNATAILAGMGLQAQFEQILDHIRQTVPGLMSIQVEYREPDDDYFFEYGVEIFVFKENAGEQSDPSLNAMDDWMLATFPTVIRTRFTIHILR